MKWVQVSIFKGRINFPCLIFFHVIAEKSEILFANVPLQVGIVPPCRHGAVWSGSDISRRGDVALTTPRASVLCPAVPQTQYVYICTFIMYTLFIYVYIVHKCTMYMKIKHTFKQICICKYVGTKDIIYIKILCRYTFKYVSSNVKWHKIRMW